MAETELSVLSTQSLDRGIADKATLTGEAAAWEAERNQETRQSRLAIYHGRCTYETKAAVSVNMSYSGH